MYAVLDTETGGFSITKNGVVEIGIVIADLDLNPVEELSMIIKPYTREEGSDELVSYKDDAMAIHGITMEEILNGEYVASAIQKVEEILKEYGVTMLVGHNLIDFDLKRVDYLYNRFLGFPLGDYQKFDTMKIAQKTFGAKAGNSLENLCLKYGIVETEKHRAVGDCHSTLKLFKVFKQEGII